VEKGAATGLGEIMPTGGEFGWAEVFSATQTVCAAAGVGIAAWGASLANRWIQQRVEIRQAEIIEHALYLLYKAEEKVFSEIRSFVPENSSESLAVSTFKRLKSFDAYFDEVIDSKIKLKSLFEEETVDELQVILTCRRRIVRALMLRDIELEAQKQGNKQIDVTAHEKIIWDTRTTGDDAITAELRQAREAFERKARQLLKTKHRRL
jgi:hypothetical protein